MGKIGVGIIGLGYIANLQAKAIASSSICNFVAGYHYDIHKAIDFCHKYKAKAYNSLSALKNPTFLN